MKKKIILAVGLVSNATLAANSAADLAVGMALDQQLSVVVEIGKTYRGIIGNGGMAFDYIVQRGKFDQDLPVTWYVGVGGWYEWDDQFGPRVPLGVNWNMHKGWDAYAQLHPQLNLYKGADLQLGGAIGVKYNF